MSQFDAIETFVLVVEENNFARAAKRLHISAAAVSKQITLLEKHLGVQLLKRTTRQLALTEMGGAYYEQCKRILSEIQHADALVSEFHKEPKGLLRVVCANYFAKRFIVPRLAEFMRRYPKVILELELAERMPDLARENIDLLFGVSLLADPELVQRKISSTHYVICASPAYLKKYGIPKKPNDLLQHHYITHTMRKPNNVLVFKDKQQIQLQPILRLNDAEAIKACALQGIGIVKLHEYMVREELATGKLQEVLEKYREPDQSIYLYYQPMRYLQPKIRCFIDFMLEAVKC